MNPDTSRQDQWMAYHLGELPEAERARVEAELNASPELAESYRRFAAAFGAWATEEVAQRPFDFQAFRAKQESRRGADVLAVPPPALRKKPFLPGRLAWALAAAALLLFALSKTQFTVTLGNTTLRWGAAEPAAKSEKEDALRAQLVDTQDQLATLQGGMEQNTQILQAIAQRQIDTEKRFTDVTDRLSYYQQVEAATRYRDTNALINELAAYRPKSSP